VPLIIDTDMSVDVDDVGALCLAHALADRGEANLLAVVHDAGYPHGVGAVSVINRFYNRDVPIGAYKGSFGRAPSDQGGDWVDGPYVWDLIQNYDPPIRNSSQVPGAVQVYRRALAAAADRSVVVAAIGFATNLAELLQSRADSISPLSGRALVERKVKLVIWQGGWYDSPSSISEERDGQSTWNWDCGDGFYDQAGGACLGTARQAVVGMPPSVQQIFSDIGDDVNTGARLSFCTPISNPCRQAYIDWQGLGNPRSSWDLVVVLAAVRGAAAVKSSRQFGRNRVDQQGTNWWEDTDDPTHATHSFLWLDGDFGDVWDLRLFLEDNIDELLCAPPRLSARRLPPHWVQPAPRPSRCSDAAPAGGGGRRVVSCHEGGTGRRGRREFHNIPLSADGQRASRATRLSARF